MHLGVEADGGCGTCRARSAAPRCAAATARGQVATIVAASAIRWSFDHGGPDVARGPYSASSAALTRHAGGFVLDALCVVEVDDPSAFACELGQHLAVHKQTARLLVPGTALGAGGVLREVPSPPFKANLP